MLDKERLTILWKRLIFPCFNGVHQATQALQIGETAPYHFHRHGRTTIQILLNISRGLLLDLPDLLTGEIRDLHPRPIRIESKMRRRRIPTAEMKEKVIATLKSNPSTVFSKRSLAAEVGVSFARLKRVMPELSERIGRKFRNHQLRKVETRASKLLQKMVVFLRLNGPKVSLYAMNQKLGISFYTRERKLLLKAREIAGRSKSQ